MYHNNENIDFLNYEHTIFPTKEQKGLLAARFDQEDSTYNTLADLVNQSYSQGAGLEALKTLVQNHPIPAGNEVERFSISQVRKRIIFPSASPVQRQDGMHQAAPARPQPAQRMLPLCRNQRLPSGSAHDRLDCDGAAP